MKENLAVFAGYSKCGQIEEYVIYYLKRLVEVADIIVVFDNELDVSERKKIEALSLHVIGVRHGEYDFGSYKLGFRWARTNSLLKTYKKLIMCNDSCFGPFYPLQPLIDRYQADPSVDFFGAYKITRTSGMIKPHLQGYFLCFKQHVFMSDKFGEFIDSVQKESQKEHVVHKYEVGLSDCLHAQGFRSDAMFSGRKYLAGSNQALLLVKRGFPFLKKSLFSPHEGVECRKLLFYRQYLKRLRLSEEADIISRVLTKNFGESIIRSYLFKIWFARTFFRPIYQKKVTSDGRIRVKICRIPLPSIRKGGTS